MGCTDFLRSRKRSPLRLSGWVMPPLGSQASFLLWDSKDDMNWILEHSLSTLFPPRRPVRTGITMRTAYKACTHVSPLRPLRALDGRGGGLCHRGGRTAQPSVPMPKAQENRVRGKHTPTPTPVPQILCSFPTAQRGSPLVARKVLQAPKSL